MPQPSGEHSLSILQHRKALLDSIPTRFFSSLLEDVELIELARILMDDDAEAALAFIKHHLKGKAKELLEGG